MDLLFTDLLQMSITGSLCIVAVILARLLLRKAPTIYSYALWFIVLFRLICPFTFESPLSFIPADAQRIPLPLMAPQAAVQEQLPGTSQVPADLQTSEIQHQQAGGEAVPLMQALEPAAQTPAASGEAAGSPDSSPPWVKVIQYVWLAGIGGMIMHSVLAAIRLKRNLRDAVHISGNLYETGRISTPFVLGILKPRIYLPAGLQEQEKVYIIKHEQVHIRRLDHLIKLIAFAVLCLHWLNPLVWLAYFLMCEDMEKSCDESVIRQLGSGIKQDYSLSLLALSSGRRFSYRSPLAFGEHGTKGRIRNILHYRKPGVWVVLLCISAIAALGAGLLGNAKQQADQAEREYARQFIDSIAASYQKAVPGLAFENKVINKLERIGEYGGLLDSPVGLWSLEYRLKPQDTELLTKLGDHRIEDGMLTEEGGMGKPVLVFAYRKSGPEYLGVIRSGENDLSRPAGQEMALRRYLEGEGQLPHETFSGTHVLVRFPLTTGETSQLLLSQPVKQGSEGIWTVERWKDTNGNEYYPIPQTEKRLEAYYADLQSEAEQGKEEALLDPVQVAIEYIKTELGQPVSRDKLAIDYEATAEDFKVTPESRLTGYVTSLAIDTDTLNFDQVEWLTMEDSDRFAALNISEEDLPGGFYILNKYEINDLYQVTAETEYKLIDREQPGSLTSVSKQEFIAYFKPLTGNAPPCTITVSNGTVTSITEVYVP